MRIFLAAFAAIILLGNDCPTFGQCSSGHCSTPTVATRAIPNYEWRSRADDPNRLYLYKDGQQIGGLDRAEGYYRTYKDGVWGDIEAAPAIAQPAERFITNYGVERDKISRESSYHLNGQPATRQEALKAIEASIPDDANKLRVTVIGSEAERAAVVKDLAASAVKDDIVVQDYPADNWAVNAVGFKTDGHPTIYVQLPDGRVKHRQDDYAGGIASLTTAIRKSDPNYDARKDPNANNTLGGFNFDFGKVPTALWWGLGFAGLIAMRRTPKPA